MPLKIKLTPELSNQICASIRAGGYPNIAAETWGVPKDIFERWLKYGRGKRAKQPYAKFWHEVSKAKAHARLKAEMQILKEDPRFWLKSGPGKETPENPGWTSVVKPILQTDNRSINFFATPDFNEFMNTIKRALANHPEALTAILDEMERGEPKQLKVIPQEPGEGSTVDPEQTPNKETDNGNLL